MTEKNNENLLEKYRLWRLADQGDFMAIIDSLTMAGVAENDMGEVLFRLADQALEDKKPYTAIAILVFITQSMEGKSEAIPLLKKIGTIYSLLSDHSKAREYFGRLPLTLEHIKLCCETFVPSLDIDGLLHLRNTILSQVTDKSNQNSIHSIIDTMIFKIYNRPEVYDKHADLFKENLICLKKIYPFSQNFQKYSRYFSFDFSKHMEPDILRYSDNLYVKQNQVWAKLFSPEQIQNLPKKKLKNHTDRLAYCDSPESFFILINRLKTSNPTHTKFECWVILDFKLLGTIMQVLDISALNDCNFVIRFIDRHNLKSQLTHLLLDRKLMIEKAVYLSQDHPEFFLKHVRPTLKECEKKMEDQIEQYEKQLTKIFKDDYQKKSIEKIKTGQKLRILFFTSRSTTYLQYSTRDIAEGFRKLGHETFIEIEDEDSGLGIRKDVTMENLINFQPDIIFAIDHLRYSRSWLPKSIPFVSWIQDLMPHLIGLSDPELIGDHDYIFSFSKHWIDHFFKNHAVLKNKRVHLLPITCDHKIYHPLPLTPKKYDVSFVGHLPDPSHTLLPLLQGNKIPETTCNNALAFLTQLASDLDDISMEHLFSLQNDPEIQKSLGVKICKKINIPFKDDYLQLMEGHTQDNRQSRFLLHIFFLLRTKPIKTLVKKGIHVRVFGHHWEKIPLFKEISMGSVKNGADLNKVYNETRINLNQSPETTYHMKAPEVIAGKNFMMTRQIPPSHDLMPIEVFFETDKEIILFQNEKELLEKVLFYLGDPEKRKQIADAAYTKFLATRTIDKNAYQILETMSIPD